MFTSDDEFVIALNKIIESFEHDMKFNAASSNELYLLPKLNKIKDIIVGEKQLGMEQKKYISLQRVLDDMEIGRTDIGGKIYDIAYYFAFVYKLTYTYQDVLKNTNRKVE